MSKVLMPPESDWGVEYFMICMHDNCPYFVKGWDWMMEKYKVKASYRNKMDTFVHRKVAKSSVSERGWHSDREDQGYSPRWGYLTFAG